MWNKKFKGVSLRTDVFDKVSVRTDVLDKVSVRTDVFDKEVEQKMSI